MAATLESLEQKIEALRTAILHLTEAVEALGERTERKPLDFSSIHGHMLHSEPPLDFSSIEGHVQVSPSAQ